MSDQEINPARSNVRIELGDSNEAGRLATNTSLGNAATNSTLAAADAYETFGRHLQVSLGETMAAFAHLAAAKIDLMNPSVKGGLGGPFNGQRSRQTLFWEIVCFLQPSVFVEIGTYRGTTTEYVAERFQGGIYTCEINRRYFEYARRRLAQFRNVVVEMCDSRSFLRRLLGLLSEATTTLFYLDAHWNEDLSLPEELQIILEKRIAGAIIIDDCAVPFDSNYGFDDYGPGKRICLTMLEPHQTKIAGLYFPRFPSDEETGAKRGAAVIAIDHDSDVRLSRIEALALRRWQAP